ncbi:anti-sigma factor family protein [Streptomyces sp. NPDC002671]
MTSTTDTAGHPDVAEISDLTEGLLPPSRSAHVRRHLDACELCADVHASLEEIRGMLGTLPGPPRMPADVAGRIDAALAAEALLNATTPEAADGTGAVSSPSESPAAHVSRETSAPADRPAGRPHATTGPGRKGSGRGRRRRTVVLGAVFTAAVLGAGTFVLQSFGDHTSDTTAHSTASSAAGPFSGHSVQNQVQELLTAKQGTQRGSERPRSGSDSGQETPGASENAHTLVQSQVPVPDCVQQAIKRSDTILGAKTGRYDGKDAYLVVLPDARDSAHVTAYVVDAACVSRQPVSAGKVLLEQSFARP